MTERGFDEWPILAAGTGLFILLVQFAELIVLAAGVAPPHEGYTTGAITATLFLGVLLYGCWWLVDSSTPAIRFRRIGEWTLAGALAGIALISTINLSMRSLDPFLVVSTVRWGGAFGGVVGIGLGIMEAQVIEQRRTADRLAARQEMLQRERDRLDEFAGIISHDLRNPLNVALGHLDMAREQAEGSADVDHHAEIEAALRRMETIIDDTLTLARHGRQVGETAEVSLERVARESWQSVDSDGARLQVENSITFTADPDRLEHVFENLYRNSVEHVGDGVTVRTGSLDEAEGFFIADDGPGITPDKREQVFERGYTDASGGTGLGLTIVERIADAHGWETDVTESASGGARFEFSGVEVQ